MPNLKKAVKHEAGSPENGLAMYLDCECGKHLSVTGGYGSGNWVNCSCGRVYDSKGWEQVDKHIQETGCTDENCPARNSL